MGYPRWKYRAGKIWIRAKIITANKYIALKSEQSKKVENFYKSEQSNKAKNF